MKIDFPKDFRELRKSAFDAIHGVGRSVKDEMRSNLQAMLRRQEPLLPGIIGYDDSVVPNIVNAILSRHNMILLGLRGQAKS